MESLVPGQMSVVDYRAEKPRGAEQRPSSEVDLKTTHRQRVMAIARRIMVRDREILDELAK